MYCLPIPSSKYNDIQITLANNSYYLQILHVEMLTGQIQIDSSLYKPLSANFLDIHTR